MKISSYPLYKQLNRILKSHGFILHKHRIFKDSICIWTTTFSGNKAIYNFSYDIIKKGSIDSLIDDIKEIYKYTIYPKDINALVDILKAEQRKIKINGIVNE
jgi:hypothetical protein